jgi:hypothetical protein
MLKMGLYNAARSAIVRTAVALCLPEAVILLLVTALLFATLDKTI